MALAVAFALAVPALASGAPGSESQPVPLSPSEAVAELEEAVAAVTEPGAADLDPTDELRDLAVAIPFLEGPERRQARRLLARPPDGLGEIFGGNWPGNAVDVSEESAHFVTHWPVIPDCNSPAQGCDEPNLADGGDPGDVPDYMDKVIAFMEESYADLNVALGWPEPKPDDGEGGNSKIDVYVADICNEGPNQPCIFGYASPDDNSQQCRTPPFRCTAYLVLDNDYQPEEFDYPSPDIPLQVTAAHEYNHILQFRLDTQQDAWMFESTAVWAEEQVFPSADDWLFYVNVWRRFPDESITKTAPGSGLRIYGSAVWNHWLDVGAGYGPDVVLDSWRKSRKSDPKDFALGAYDLAIRQHGGKGVEHEFGRFAAATAEWRLDEFGFPDGNEYKRVKREGTLKPGGRAIRFELDHTAYRLLRVKSRGQDRVRLTVRAPRGVAAAIALVAREGATGSGTATTKLDFGKKGGRLATGLRDARKFERITAVVANADAKVRGGRGPGERYVHDDERFRARLR